MSRLANLESRLAQPWTSLSVVSSALTPEQLDGVRERFTTLEAAVKLRVLLSLACLSRAAVDVGAPAASAQAKRFARPGPLRDAALRLFDEADRDADAWVAAAAGFARQRLLGEAPRDARDLHEALRLPVSRLAAAVEASVRSAVKSVGGPPPEGVVSAAERLGLGKYADNPVYASDPFCAPLLDMVRLPAPGGGAASAYASYKVALPPKGTPLVAVPHRHFGVRADTRLDFAHKAPPPHLLQKRAKAAATAAAPRKTDESIRNKLFIKKDRHGASQSMVNRGRGGGYSGARALDKRRAAKTIDDAEILQMASAKRKNVVVAAESNIPKKPKLWQLDPKSKRHPNPSRSPSPNPSSSPKPTPRPKPAPERLSDRSPSPSRSPGPRPPSPSLSPPPAEPASSPKPSAAEVHHAFDLEALHSEANVLKPEQAELLQRWHDARARGEVALAPDGTTSGELRIKYREEKADGVKMSYFITLNYDMQNWKKTVKRKKTKPEA
uniref:Uncharacterized protein n=1 Tax=Phaeomonas parva TaxID=124430 RepID=A0A7S1TPL8_9STRA|mmetsp:Transcript_10060/g.29826  ORF Transcript_10060/g.29826 Transcript_10060/m.29826 type:complete len:497 (+) Transcript_10060:32-1522(+)